MIIEQKPEFQPITITLETADEAESLWYAVRTAETRSVKEAHALSDLSNWFNNHAQLGG